MMFYLDCVCREEQVGAVVIASSVLHAVRAHTHPDGPETPPQSF